VDLEKMDDPRKLHYYVELNQLSHHDLIQEHMALEDHVEIAMDRLVKILRVDKAGRNLHSLSHFAERELQDSDQRAALLEKIRLTAAGSLDAEAAGGPPVNFRQTVSLILDLARSAPEQPRPPN